MAKAGIGRPSMPLALKLLSGEVRPSRLNVDEPVPSTREVVPPAWLDPAALAVWAEYAPDLIARNVLTAWDCAAFACFCAAVARHAEASRLLVAEGLLVAGARAGQVKLPAAQLTRDFADLVLRFGGRFGLTPADRSAIRAAPTPTAPGGPERLLS